DLSQRDEIWGQTPNSEIQEFGVCPQIYCASDGRQLPPAHRLFSSHTYSRRPSSSQSGRSVNSKSCEKGRVKIFGSSMVIWYKSLFRSRFRCSIVWSASLCHRVFAGSV